MSELGRKLLIIVREGPVVVGLQKAFIDAGYEAFGATDDFTALEMLQKLRPDIVLFEPESLKTDIKNFLKLTRSASTAHAPVRLFALSHLPYRQESCRVIEIPEIKIITTMMPIAEVLRTVKLHLSLSQARINYNNGTFQMVLAAIEQLFVAYLKSQFVVGRVSAKRGEKVPGNVLAAITLSGKGVIGSLAVGFDQAFGSALASAMIGEKPGGELYKLEELTEIAGEIANQLAGIIQGKFHGRGLETHIGLPRTITGAPLRFVHPGRNNVVSIPVSVAEPRGILANIFGKEAPSAVIEFCFDADG